MSTPQTATSVVTNPAPIVPPEFDLVFEHLTRASDARLFIEIIPYLISIVQERARQRKIALINALITAKLDSESKDKILKKIAEKSDFNNLRAQYFFYELQDTAEEIEKELSDDDEKTWERAYRALVKMYALWVGKRFQENGGKKASFSITVDHNVIELQSVQLPVTNDLYPHFYGCYHRSGNPPGLPAHRKYKLFIKDQSKSVLECFLNASPVPYYIDAYAERMRGTRQNLQACSEVQLRLLSPTEGIFRLLEPKSYFSKLKDYDQLFEMHHANILNRTEMGEHKQVRLINFGVNLGRRVASPLQDMINTPEINDLIRDVFSKIGLDNVSRKIRLNNTEVDVDDLRTELVNNTKASYNPETKSEKETKAEFLRLLTAHHVHEKALFKLNKIAWANCYKEVKDKLGQFQDNVRNIIFLFNTVMQLLENNKYRSSDYNYYFQAIVALLYVELGVDLGMGCNDAKDRAGSVLLGMESCKIFLQIKGRYPNILDKKDRTSLAAIEKELFDNSSPKLVAEAISMPGYATGVGVSNKSLPGNDRHKAAIIRKIFPEKTPAQPYELISIKTKQVENGAHKNGVADEDVVKKSGRVIARALKKVQDKLRVDKGINLLLTDNYRKSQFATVTDNKVEASETKSPAPGARASSTRIPGAKALRASGDWQQECGANRAIAYCSKHGVSLSNVTFNQEDRDQEDGSIEINRFRE